MQRPLVEMNGAWSLHAGKSHIILVSDEELVAISDDPDRVIDLSLTYQKEEGSLRSVCERAAASGHRTLIVAHDHFFHQYRPGQFSPRRLTPDTDEAIERTARISQFAAQYGLGLELSLLSPLEIGPVAARATGSSGRWMQYRKGVRDPRTGNWSVEMWRQRRWANNKGVIELVPDGVRVFAFREEPIPGTNYSVVDPASIVDIGFSARHEVLIDDENRTRVRYYGGGDAGVEGLDRILVVQELRSPEMDYFAESSMPYLKSLCDRYVDAGVVLNALYSDELHIQQDWIYADHHDHGQLAIRYVSEGLQAEFAGRFGPEYADFAKWLVYFCSGQEDWRHDIYAAEAVQHVLGGDPDSIRRTQLLRHRYYKLLQDGVVDLFAGAKRYLESRLGKTLEARAHSTWAESPTIDFWRRGPKPMYQSAYEYTPDFLWSNTVHQASAACHDYFKWCDFLTASGNDHAECGWSDRNYMGIALACSLALVTEIPLNYAAHWGMPAELGKRRSALVDASGCAGSPVYAMVQGMEHRRTDVLFLYPLDLVALDERFGSWTAQYGYADTVTQDVLIDRGKVVEGAVEIRGRRYGTVVVLCEPFPHPGLLPMLAEAAASGASIIWAGAPPRIDREGASVLSVWQDLFRVDAHSEWMDGLPAPGRRVDFVGALTGLEPMTILTDFPVDRLHPVVPREGTEVVSTTAVGVVGSSRTLGNGRAVFLGFRPRDDQSASLGYETRYWFDILRSFGGHAGDDNPEALSRTTPWFCCGFANGAVGIAPHFRDVPEDWEGGFGRDEQADAAYLERCPAPSNRIELERFRIRGVEITYGGRHALTVRANADGLPVAFAGAGSDRIVVNGRETIFADRLVDEVGWAPIDEHCRVSGGATWRIWCTTPCRLRLPIAIPGNVRVVAQGPVPGGEAEVVPSGVDQGILVVEVTAEAAGRWMFVVPED